MLEASQFPSVVLSNVGQVPIGQVPIGQVPIEVRFGPFTPTSLGFVVNPSFLCTLNSTAATVNGQLTWCVGGMEPLVSRSRTAGIADRALAILRSSLTAPG